MTIFAIVAFTAAMFALGAIVALALREYLTSDGWGFLTAFGGSLRRAIRSICLSLAALIVALEALLQDPSLQQILTPALQQDFPRWSVWIPVIVASLAHLSKGKEQDKER